MVILLSKDADFVICGEINANDVKAIEGPFGDHLGLL